MNRLRGRIKGIESNGHVSLVDVDVDGQVFVAILLESPQTAPYLVEGNAVDVLFKETEVSLAKNLTGLISLRNRVQTAVRHIHKGEILSEVELDYHGRSLTSIVTSRSIARLELKEGDAVEALVKANEVSLQEVTDEP